MPDKKTDLLQGTLDLLILKIITDGPIHGYGIAQRLTHGNFRLADNPLRTWLCLVSIRGFMSHCDV
jgi:hypothetical protein